MHLIPAQLVENGVMFINNYVDWDQYNNIYNEDFESQGRQDALAFAARYRIKEVL